MLIDVLHLTEACGGGVRRHLDLLLPELQALGVRNGFLAFSERAEEDFRSKSCQHWRECGIPYGYFPIFSCYYIPWVIRSLEARLQRCQPRVLHLHAGWAGIIGRMKLHPDLKVVYSPHSFHYHPGMPWYKRVAVSTLERKLAARTDLFCLVSEAEKEQAAEMRVPMDRAIVIPNALPENYAHGLLPRAKARQQLGIPASEHAAVVPCRLVWQKGIDVLLQAVAQMPQRPTPPVFYCYGDGEELHRLQKLGEQLDIMMYLRFPGWIADMSSLLAAFDLAVLPSRYEACSYALLECLAAGLPVVASDIPAHATYSGLKSLRLCARDNPEALAATILQTIKENAPTDTPMIMPYTLADQALRLKEAYGL